MRALRLHFLEPLVIAAAALSAILAAHPAIAPTHASVAFALTACPEGTNWDNAISTCL